MAEKTWDMPTRILHWLLVVTICLQLATSFLVDDPHTRLYFYVHEYIGLLAGLVILAHWMWSYANGDLRIMFPWGGERWAKVKSEFRELLHGKLSMGGRQPGLSSFVHGLGFLTVSMMAFTGFLIYEVIPGGRGASANSHHYQAFTNLSGIHAFFSYFLWAYMIGHVGTALLHLFRKEHVFGEIFLDSTPGR